MIATRQALRALTALAAAGVLASCSGGSAAPDTSATAFGPGVKPQVVKIERSDVARALTLTGSVVGYPARTVLAPATGTFTASVRRGATVAKGTRLGRIRHCGVAPDRAPAPAATAALDPVPACPSPKTYSVVSPASGVVTTIVDGEVSIDSDVASVKPKGLHASLAIGDSSTKYAFAKPPKVGTGRIVGGPAGFEVRFERLSAGEGAAPAPADPAPSDGGMGGPDMGGDGSGSVSPGAALSVETTLPTNLALFEGLDVVVEFKLAKATNVPTLPLSAVHGRKDEGQVIVLDAAGRKRVVDIKLGSFDERVIQVGALPMDAQVVQYPLESDFA